MSGSDGEKAHAQASKSFEKTILAADVVRTWEYAVWNDSLR